MTTKDAYRKRLQDHLKETKSHARQVERRIKQLGGKAEAGPSGPGALTPVAGTATSLASKAVAAAQGPLHALRGTGGSEKMWKNARTELTDEFHEIGQYTAIEALAESVGDKETAKLAKSIRREEERMANFLQKQIPQLVKAVAREEIPAAERRNGSSSSRRRSSSSSRSSSSARSGSSRSSSGSSRSGSSRTKASSSRTKASSSRAKSGSSRTKSGSSRSRASSSGSGSGSSRSGSSRSSGSRSGGSARSRRSS
jgi:hypothetical protein